LQNLSPEIKLNENIVAPIIAGTSLGSVTYTVDNIEYTTELLASHDVEEKLSVEIFVLIIGVILLFLGITILKKNSRKKVRNKKRKK